MVLIKWKFPCGVAILWLCRAIYNIFNNIKCCIVTRVMSLFFHIRCITYNEHVSNSYIVDFFLEPIFWFVDNFAQCLGKAFVFSVCALTTAVVMVAYWIGLPYWWQRCPYTTTFLVIFGNWILLNVVYHYYMGVITSPGYPPPGTMVADAASLCKKCISPKPARTHHCSVCDRCILAMDHHCPWLNNCVGYFNARHFYLYMVYVLVGVMFIIIAGIDIGYQVLWLEDTGGLIPNDDPVLIGHPVYVNQSGALIPVKDIVEYDAFNSPREHILPVPAITETQRIAAHYWKRKAVMFMAITCVAVLLALGTLTVMHGKNISRGETSIEAHVNGRLRKLQGIFFRNPYNFGRSKNWKLFLGLTQGRTFWRHVLLPSSHRPTGNGVIWHTVHNRIVLEDWP